VLRRFGPKRPAVIRGWKKSHDEFHKVHFSSNIIEVTKLSRMRWVGYVSLMRGNAYKILVGNPV